MSPATALMLASVSVLVLLAVITGENTATTSSSSVQSCEWRITHNGLMICQMSGRKKKTSAMTSMPMQVPSKPTAAICEWPTRTSTAFAKRLPDVFALNMSCGLESVDGAPIMDAATFKAVLNVSFVYVANMPLMYAVPSDTFCDLSRLFRLDMHNVKIKRLDQVGIGTSADIADVCHSSCGAAVQLKVLRITNSHLSSIERKAPFCSLSQLEELNFDRNRLNNIEPDAFMNLVNLVDVSMSHNSLTVLASGLFATQKKLRVLDISHNRLSTVKGAFDGLDYLRFLHLNNNQLKRLTNDTFAGIPFLRNLFVSNNRIVDIEEGALASLSFLEMISLDNNGLTHLPPVHAFIKGSESCLTYLNLSQNSISEIGPIMSALTALRELNMNNNRLTRLTSATFDNQENLQYLMLDGNMIEKIDGTIFALNNSLRNLHLAHNRLKDMPDLSRLEKVQQLDLSHNLIDVLPQDAFVHTVNLAILNLRGNRLRMLSDRLFETLPYLTILDLADNEITTVGNDTFAGLAHLMLLNMQNNRFNFSQNIFYYSGSWVYPLMNVYRELDRLESLDLSGNGIVIFEYFWFPTSLRSLSLAHNAIRTIPSSATGSIHRSQMTFLNLSHNVIEIVESRSFTDYDRSPKIATPLLLISLESNRIKTLYRNFSHNNQGRFLLDGNSLICDCQIGWMQSSQQPTMIIEIVDLEKLTCRPSFVKRGNGRAWNVTRRIMDINLEDFLCEFQSLLEADTATVCSLDPRHALMEVHKPCEYLCPEQCRCFRDANWEWIVLDCSFGSLDSIPSRLTWPKTTVLYLDANQLTSVHANDLQWLPLLRRLYLNANLINVLDEDTFSRVETLEVLHLDHNELTQLSDDQFVSQRNLRTLDLSHNRLANLSSIIFQPLVALQFLKLSNNRLVDFPVWLLQHLTEVSLAANPWSCNCDYALFYREWIHNFAGKVFDKQDVNCEMDNGALVSLITFNGSKCYEVQVKLESQVFLSPAWYSKMWIASFPAFFIVVAVLLLVYQKEVQVLLYWHMGMRVFHNGDEAQHDANKEYDAFVSYSSVDENFIVNDLLPGLEKDVEIPYKLCLHHRDFLGGAYINESICNAIATSRRTLLILSSNFVQSKYCRLEFKTAHAQMLMDRCKRLIVVVFGDMPNDLDPEIQLYLRTYTYIKWGDKLFWKKLYFALPDRKRATPHVHDIELPALPV